MSAFSTFRLTKGADEILFGEMVRMMVRDGYPMAHLESSEHVHTGRFLMVGTPLFSMEIAVKRHTTGFVLSKMTDIPVRVEIKGMAVIKGNRYSQLKDLYRIKLNSFVKTSFLGDVKVKHEYNRIHISGALVGRGSNYFISGEVVDKGYLIGEIRKAIEDILDVLDRFTTESEGLEFVDERFDMKGNLDRIETEIARTIEDEKTMTVICPNCSRRFDTLAGGPVKCPSCGLKGALE